MIIELADASGNLTHDPPGSPVRHTYTYDAENRLSGVTDQGITYTYDAEGRRVGMYTAGALTRTYLRDQDQSSFLVFDGAGNLSSLDLFEAGRHLFHDGYSNGTGSGGYIIADALGTTKEVTAIRASPRCLKLQWTRSTEESIEFQIATHSFQFGFNAVCERTSVSSSLPGRSA